MSNPTTETVLGIPVQAVDVRIGDTDVCKRCCFNIRPQCLQDGILCHPENRADRRNVYFIKIEEPEMLPTTKAPPMPPVPPTVVPAPPKPTVSTKRLATDLESLTKAEETLALLRKQHRLFAEQPMRYGFSLAPHQSHGKVILRSSATNTTIEVESALLRQAFEVHQEALLQTLLDLHAQQVAQMKAGLSEQLLDLAVEYRK